MYRIFIVEDDPVIAGAMRRHLEGWGYEVAQAERFDSVLSEFAAFDPQLVLLDISLPFFNGYHWCTEIRRVSKVPIIFVSSASDNVSMVTAMQMGGDDLLPKPFALGAVLNLSDGTLTAAGQRVELTKNEHKILQLLLERKGSIVSRETIMECLWASDSFVDENTLSVNVNRLRKKLEGIGLAGLLATRKGQGYALG